MPALAEPNDPLGRKLNEPLWDDDDYGYGDQLLEAAAKTPARTLVGALSAAASTGNGQLLSSQLAQALYDPSAALDSESLRRFRLRDD